MLVNESDDVRTPALLLDLEQVDRNIGAMAAHAAGAGVDMWPHVKTHKSVTIARRQVAAGAKGLTVATVREAEVLADAGFAALLLAQPPVGVWRMRRVIELARRVDLRVALDSLDVAFELDRAAAGGDVDVDVLWEVDAGLGRCGTLPGEPTAAQVSALVQNASRLRFCGLLTFPGHAYAASDRDGVAAVSDQEQRAMAATVRALAGRGLEAEVRSFGSTPTAPFVGSQPLATELRPGNYVYNDMTQVRLGIADIEQCALSVLGTVVSRPTPTRVILDSGSKSLAAERMSALTATLGHVVGHPELRVERLFEEHAIIEADSPVEIDVGERLRVIPNHACTAANLHATMLVVADGRVVDEWALDARGWDPAEPARRP